MCKKKKSLKCNREIASYSQALCENKLVKCAKEKSCSAKLRLRDCSNDCVVLFCSIKYDAYRQRVDSIKAAQTSGRNTTSSLKIREIEAALQQHRQRYERLQSDLVIKLKFLEENKVN